MAQVGIGITIKTEEGTGKCTVLNTVVGGAAFATGKIAPGDKLLGVWDKERDLEWIDVYGKDFHQVKGLILGPKGSKVSLMLQKSDLEGVTYYCEDIERGPQLTEMSICSSTQESPTAAVPPEVRIAKL